MLEMARSFGCSEHKVVYWMNKFGIKRRTWSEATYLKANPKGDPFKISKKSLLENQFLYGLSLGIFWGEGGKTSRHQVRVANTDPAMLRVFRRFLLEVCNLEVRKISYSIICFNDTNSEDARRYWSQQLEISPEKFGKITQIPQQGKGTYKKKSAYGVCTIAVCNMKLMVWMLEQLDDLKRSKMPRWLSGRARSW